MFCSLGALANASPAFNMRVFSRFVKDKWLPKLKPKGKEKLEEELEVLISSEGSADGGEMTGDFEFDGSTDFA